MPSGTREARPPDAMARKFLYIVAGLTVLVILILLAMRIWADKLTEMAFTPTSEFSEPKQLAEDAYSSSDMWISRPGLGKGDPALWLPEGASPSTHSLGAAVFFIHPTSYFEKTHWNAQVGDKESRKLAGRWVREMASPFNTSADIWAPRYRQATFGAFLTDTQAADLAIDAAYGDVANAFETFLKTVDPDRPIILAGHSQGALLLRRLIAERVKGTPLEKRIAAAYIVGWPLSLKHDLPQLGLPACASPDQARCIVSWQSFAEPAETEMVRKAAEHRGWLDGRKGDGRPFLCSNPLSGMTAGQAAASANLGSLIDKDDSGNGELEPGLIPARCSKNGFLFIGEPPDLGKWVLPGNNYHVYDIPMFWANLRKDVAGRVEAWEKTH